MAITINSINKYFIIYSIAKNEFKEDLEQNRLLSYFHLLAFDQQLLIYFQ